LNKLKVLDVPKFWEEDLSFSTETISDSELRESVDVDRYIAIGLELPTKEQVTAKLANWKHFYEGDIPPVQAHGSSSMIVVDGQQAPAHFQKFGQCSIPKNGCSRWRRLLRRVEGHEDYLANPHHLANWATLTTDLKRKTFHRFWETDSYFNMIIVRNPMTRILSGYIEKK